MKRFLLYFLILLNFGLRASDLKASYFSSSGEEPEISCCCRPCCQWWTTEVVGGVVMKTLAFGFFAGMGTMLFELSPDGVVSWSSATEALGLGLGLNIAPGIFSLVGELGSSFCFFSCSGDSWNSGSLCSSDPRSERFYARFFTDFGCFIFLSSMFTWGTYKLLLVPCFDENGFESCQFQIEFFLSSVGIRFISGLSAIGLRLGAHKCWESDSVVEARKKLKESCEESSEACSQRSKSCWQQVKGGFSYLGGAVKRFCCACKRRRITRTDIAVHPHHTV